MTLQELSSKHSIHSNQITTWKKEFLANASSSFEKGKDKETFDKEKEGLYSKIGQLQVEVDFLKTVLDK